MTHFSEAALGAARDVATYLGMDDLKAVIGDRCRTVAEALPGGKGVRAFSDESGVSPATVTRAAAAGALLLAFDTLPGKTPAGVTGDWALKAAREAARGGIGGKAIRAAIAEADTSAALWAIVGGGVADAKAAVAADKASREARPNDGTGEDVVPEPSEDLSAVGGVLKAQRSIVRGLKAIRKADTFGPEDAADLAKLATALDAAAREVQGMRDHVATLATDPTPEPVDA